MKNKTSQTPKKVNKEEDGSVDSLGKIPSGPLRKKKPITAQKFLKYVKKSQ